MGLLQNMNDYCSSRTTQRIDILGDYRLPLNEYTIMIKIIAYGFPNRVSSFFISLYSGLMSTVKIFDNQFAIIVDLSGNLP